MRSSTAISKSETAHRAEQRREPRHAAIGEVVFCFDNAPGEVRARLLDRSTTGFRAEHDSSELTCGQLIEFRFGASPKKVARVVWTRIAGGRVESGFLILR